MKIKEIYKKYNIHPNLIEHMLRVAKVTQFICNHWKGVAVDSDKIVKLSLVHDLGNLVRMKIEDNYWGEIKTKTIEKYGVIDHNVTVAILNEIGVNEDFTNTILTKQFKNSIKIEASNDWDLKILLYSDLRVAPYGIVSLKDRLDEVISRRQDLSDNTEIDKLCNANFNIEKQIQENVNISLDSINEKSVVVNNDKFLTIEMYENK